jgi:hypothetical protein
MCDFANNHRGKFRNVLRADLSVEGLDESAFTQVLLRSYNASFAAALTAAETDPNCPARYSPPVAGKNPVD